MDGASTAAILPSWQACIRGRAVRPPTPGAERSAAPASPRRSLTSPGQATRGRTSSPRDNLGRALRRVERNGGAPGPDGMTTEALRPHLRVAWPDIRRSLDEGTYRPSPVRRVTIPKPGGGTRELGVPTGARPLPPAGAEPGPHAPLRTLLLGPQLRLSARAERPPGRGDGPTGHRGRADLGRRYRSGPVLRPGTHDALMARVARRVDDRRVLRLIRRYLDAGVMIAGVKVATAEGAPQGSPLTPAAGQHHARRPRPRAGAAGPHLRPLCRRPAGLRGQSERAASRVLEGVTDLRGRTAQAQGEPREERGRPGDRSEASWASASSTRGQGEGQARPQDEASPEGSTTPAHLPALGRSRCRCGSPASTGSSLAGPPTSPWPRRRRCSTSSTSGSADGCDRSAGRSGSGPPLGGATSSPSVSRTG